MKVSNVGKVINVYKNNANVNKKDENKKTAGDRIEISNTGREISKYVEIAKNTEIKNNRVDEIKELIKQGKYNIDSEKLAKGILDEMKERDS
jgi:negative regulator of flagellin synthesis FlgM